MKNIILIAVFAMSLFLSACERQINIGCISPVGSMEMRTVDFATFDRIEINGDADVFITEGPVQEVVIEAAPNIIDRLTEDSRVTNGELKIEINGCSRLDDDDLIVRITMPTVSGLEINGDGLYETVGLFNNVTDLVVDISGDGRMKLELGDINMLSAEIDGDARLDFQGSAALVEFEISGDAAIDFFDFPTEEVRVNINGDATCRFNVIERLRIGIQGDGDIEAIGTASVQDINIMGDGDIDNFELYSEVTNIKIVGSGDCEVRISDELNVQIIGDGKVCYKGDGDVNVDTPTTGKVTDCN